MIGKSFMENYFIVRPRFHRTYCLRFLTLEDRDSFYIIDFNLQNIRGFSIKMKLHYIKSKQPGQ